MSAAASSRGASKRKPSGPSKGILGLRWMLLLVAAMAALVAVLSGLSRVGIGTALGSSFAGAHGALFVVGVFGVVIPLERAVALARRWGYAAPALAALAVGGTLAGFAWAPWVGVGAMLGLVAVNGAIIKRQSAAFTWLMLFGAALLLLGTLLWAMGRPIFEIVPTWMGFFVLTIVAERIELSRLAPTPRWASRAVVGLSILYSLSLVGAAFLSSGFIQVAGVLTGLLGLWQLRFDLARRTIRQPGLPRFVAWGVLLGGLWLVVTGLLMAWFGLPPAGPLYDAILHSVFVGFALSMVFAHAPIILPAVARINVTFSRALYLPLLVLHLGLVARVAGDLVGELALRQVGSLANVMALGLFGITVVGTRLIKR